MRVLVACEESQRVAGAFRANGHDAWSCDILPCAMDKTYHIQDDVLKHLNDGWDLMIAHPPCTYLCVSGARWLYDIRFPNRKQQQKEAIDFFMELANAPIEYIAIENPVGVMSSYYREPDQIIQPNWFGESASKATCLWLKNLPPLIHSSVTKLEYVTTRSGKKWEKWFFENSNISDRKMRSQMRSRTFEGIAQAMADQWGSFISGNYKYVLL